MEEMKNDNLVTIIYRKNSHWSLHDEACFLSWLKRIKSYKDFQWYFPNEFNVYIDPKNIDYIQMLNYWFIFVVYRVKGREQLEKLLSYLPEEDAKDFNEWFIDPWKKNLLDKKNKKIASIAKEIKDEKWFLYPKNKLIIDELFYAIKENTGIDVDVNELKK